MTIDAIHLDDALTVLLDKVARDLETIAVPDPSDSTDLRINAMLARVAARVRALSPADLGLPTSYPAALTALADILSDDALYEIDAPHAMRAVVDMVRRQAR